jgi:hypothetical protein
MAYLPSDNLLAIFSARSDALMSGEGTVHIERPATLLVGVRFEEAMGPLGSISREHGRCERPMATTAMRHFAETSKFLGALQ